MIKLGIYKHYKGNLYRVVGIAKHSETFEDLVYYEALYENSESRFWVRPLDIFCEEIEIDGKKIKRFEFISDN